MHSESASAVFTIRAGERVHVRKNYGGDAAIEIHSATRGSRWLYISVPRDGFREGGRTQTVNKLIAALEQVDGDTMMPDETAEDPFHIYSGDRISFDKAHGGSAIRIDTPGGATRWLCISIPKGSSRGIIQDLTAALVKIRDVSPVA